VSAPVLSVRGLRVSFPGLASTVEAVRGATFEVAEGEVLGLVGESGCGKSVTSLACLGLVPGPGVVSGSIEVAGREVVGRTEAELAPRRGGTAAMIFQSPMAAMNPFFTIGQQMVHPIRLHRRLDARAAREAALASLRSVRLPDPEIALARYPHQLSGGQLQRTMIAMALACRPRLLIADEPTTALDVTVQAQIIVLLRELARREGLSILFITHDLGVVASLCDRVVVMYAGTIVEEAPVSQLFARPAHPYTRRLLETVPAVGRGRVELEAIPGSVPDLSRPPPGCAFHPRCPLASGVCSEQQPAVRDLAAGHSAACHHVEGTLRLDAFERAEAG